VEVLLALGVVILIAVVDAVRLEVSLWRRGRATDRLIEGWRRRDRELERLRRNSDRGLN